jgi:predicted ester cyclase
VGDVIDAMLELWNGGDIRAVDDIYTDPVRLGGVPRPRREVTRVLERSRTSFPDQHYQVEDRINGPSRVFLRLAWSGTQAGTWESPYGQIAPTDRRFSVSVLELYELAGNWITGAWLGLDRTELIRQLGVEVVQHTQ